MNVTIVDRNERTIARNFILEGGLVLGMAYQLELVIFSVFAYVLGRLFLEEEVLPLPYMLHIIV